MKINEALNTNDFIKVITDLTVLNAKYDAALNALQARHQELDQVYSKLLEETSGGNGPDKDQD